MSEQLTFKKVLLDAEDKYRSKLPEYGESWKDCPVNVLRRGLKDEYDEWINSFSKFVESEEYGELLDVINMACMIAERIKEGEVE